MSTETTTDLYRDYLDAALRAAEGDRTLTEDGDGPDVQADGLVAALLGFAAGKCIAGCPSQGGAPLLSRSALLAIIAGKCSAEPQPEPATEKVGALRLLDAIDKWKQNDEDQRSREQLMQDLRREVTS